MFSKTIFQQKGINLVLYKFLGQKLLDFIHSSYRGYDPLFQKQPHCFG